MDFFFETDIDECQSGSFSCHAQAQCVNNPGSYNCKCLSGYVGDGKNICDASKFPKLSECHIK